MQLQLTSIGLIRDDCPKVFYRVETWMTGRRVADFTNEAEAHRFAIEDARNLRYDHKVVTMKLS
jgi:hypothetical protein